LKCTARLGTEEGKGLRCRRPGQKKKTHFIERKD
jgi:hypothetical protein